jgi:hypothetical protein
MPELADRYRTVMRKADGLHEGGTLSHVAAQVLKHLPQGRLWIVSTSLEGTSIAAACSAIASRRDIRWDRVTLTRPVEGPKGAKVVVVEPTDPGAGWRQMVARHLPHARVVIIDATRE